jgi:PAS domain S-box-containing protein
MKLKDKLTLGLSFLFVVILVFGILSLFYINRLSKDAEQILKNNEETLLYNNNMLRSLEDMPGKKEAVQAFDDNLKKQEHNITEAGEGEATAHVRAAFHTLMTNPADTTSFSSIRLNLYRVNELNQQAILRKNAVAKNTANDAMLWLTIIFTVLSLVTLSFVVNFPTVLSNPIYSLNEGIRSIANKNYSKRIFLKQKDEFGELANAFNTMAAKLEEYESSNLANILFEKKRIETLINNMHDPVIGLDENKKILFVNEEATRIIGLKQDQLINHTAQDVAVTNDLVRYLIKDLIVTENASKEPLKIYADNKESFFEKEVLQISVTPTGEHETKHLGYVIMLKNITAFKELDFAKTNFIATVSHELKTPISSIKMSLQLLEDKRVGVINNEQHELIDNIRDDAERLLKITGELLNMSQVETGNMQLNIADAEVEKIIQYAVDATKVQAEQKHVAIVVQQQPGAMHVIADEEKTAWVLTNLLSNAIRYSHEHTNVLLNINTKENEVMFSVVDSGQGIAPEYNGKIFSRYFKVPGTKKDGTGLGLSISKDFIEAQGGHIGFSSEYGAGSNFFFSLKKSVGAI